MSNLDNRHELSDDQRAQVGGNHRTSHSDGIAFATAVIMAHAVIEAGRRPRVVEPFGAAGAKSCSAGRRQNTSPVWVLRIWLVGDVLEKCYIFTAVIPLESEFDRKPKCHVEPSRRPENRQEQQEPWKNKNEIIWT